MSSPFPAIKLPLATPGYDRVDQDRTRKLIELALFQLSQVANTVAEGSTSIFTNVYTKDEINALLAALTASLTGQIAAVNDRVDFTETLLRATGIFVLDGDDFVVDGSGNVVLAGEVVLV